jgi:hypothetical protein
MSNLRVEGNNVAKDDGVEESASVGKKLSWRSLTSYIGSSGGMSAADRVVEA